MRPKTILLVHDEPSKLEFNRGQLERLGYRVLAATGGKDAIRIYMERSDEIDLVVLDVITLDVVGGEALRLIKQLDRGTKVLVVTGASSRERIMEISSMGVGAIMQKPYQPGELAEVLRRLLD